MTRFKTTPFDHQLQEIESHARVSGRAVFWEQGTGKSKLTIDTAAELRRAGEIDGVLILAPGGVHLNWLINEIPAHLPEELAKQVHSFGYRTNRANTKWHQKAVLSLLNNRSAFAWLAMTYDGIMTDKGRLAAWNFLKKRGGRVLYVLDESGSVKSAVSKRTQRVVASGRYAKYRRILDGTPVSNGPFDVYKPVQFVDPTFWKRKGVGTYAEFKVMFGVWKVQSNSEGSEYPVCVAYKNLDLLYEWLDEISTRVLKSEVLDLPPKLYSKRYFEMTPKQSRLYATIRDEFEAELNGQTVTAELPIVRLLRLHQITSGYVPTEETEDEEDPHVLIDTKNPRLDLLMETLEPITHGVIIWARFRKDIDLILEKLGKAAVRYDGHVSDDDRMAAVTAFQQGKVQYFVGNPAAGGTGITLTAANTVVYYNNSFKLRDRLQSEDRPHRIGQEHPVQYIDLLAENTVDEHILRNLRQKMNVSNQVLGDEVKEWI